MVKQSARLARMLPDPYALWENCEALREAVRDDLYEWGGAQRGGLPNLDYPSKNILHVRPEENAAPLYDPEKIEEMDQTFRWWTQVVQQLCDPDHRAQQRRMMRAIRVYFIAQLPAEACAHRLGVSRATFYRVLGDAMRRFWMLHDTDRGVYSKSWQLRAPQPN